MTNAAGGPPKKGMSGCVMAIVAVVVLLIIIGCCGGGGWFVYRMYQRAHAAAVTAVDSLDQRLPGMSPGVPLDGKVPESFPKDIPQFYGLKPVEGITTPNGGGQQTFQGKADVNEVIGYYQQEMGKAGWDAHGSQATGDTTVMPFTKDDRQATVTVTGGTERDVTVQIFYGKQEGVAETKDPGTTPPQNGGTRQPTDSGGTADQPRNVTGEQTGGGGATGDTGGGTGAGTGGPAVSLKATKLPSNYPSDVPVYEGMTVTFSVGNIAEDKGSIIAEGKVDRDAMMKFYKQKLKAAGFAVSTNVEVAEMTQVSFTKGDRTVLVQVSPGDNGLSTLLIEYSGK